MKKSGNISIIPNRHLVQACGQGENLVVIKDSVEIPRHGSCSQSFRATFSSDLP